MRSVNMLEAKTRLSKLAHQIERGQEQEIVITRNGRPVARLVPIATHIPGKRIGLLKGKFKAPSLERLDAYNENTARLFASIRSRIESLGGIDLALPPRKPVRTGDTRANGARLRKAAAAGIPSPARKRNPASSKRR